MIEVKSVAKRYGPVAAVREVSFTARDGRVTGVLGPNGAGKTTALRMVGGLVAPDSGQVLVDGVDPRVEPASARARLGLLPDARGLYARLTARENVRYFGELCGLSGASLERRIDHLFVRLEAGPIADRQVAGFSQGERMKVAIARALVHDPPNVVLDEPTNGLDVMSIRSLRGFVRELRDQGRTVVLSSHVMQEVAALCDEVVIVAEGRSVASGRPDELVARTGSRSLEEAFVALAISEDVAGEPMPEEPAT